MKTAMHATIIYGEKDSGKELVAQGLKRVFGSTGTRHKIHIAEVDNDKKLMRALVKGHNSWRIIVCGDNYLPTLAGIRQHYVERTKRPMPRIFILHASESM